jgi:hypothetical protein
MSTSKEIRTNQLPELVEAQTQEAFLIFQQQIDALQHW